MTTTVHVHELAGCRPDVLGLYLKALGVLRLVAEQRDPEARGFWRDEAFILVTRLTREEVVEFFATLYRPTPIVSPWNKGSGFFTARDPGLTPVEACEAPRFEPLRCGIRAARDLCNELGAAINAVKEIKVESNAIKNKTAREELRKSAAYGERLRAAERRCKTTKAEFIPLCRKRWRGRHLEWLNAALVVDEHGGPRFPALLGTGGNDGRLDFTNNYYKRLGTLFDLASPAASPLPGVRELATASLFGAPNRGLTGGAVGQFLPGGAGGANSTCGPDGPSQLNTWDFVLALEGTVLFTAHASQKYATTTVRASAPFAVEARAAGYASASADDESQRGEQWMPLWREPWSLEAVRQVLAEGRCQIGARASRDPIDMARAIARMGVARGIGAFERFGYIERNGQSNLAVPLGRWRVVPRPEAELLGDLDVWLGRLHRAARHKNAPTSLVAAARSLDDAVLAALAHDEEPRRWQEILFALAAVEERLVASTGFTGARRLAPIPPLDPGWVRAVDDDSAEMRLALALAGARAAARKDGQRDVDRVRRHWLPLDRFGRAFVIREKRLAHDPGVVCHGRGAVTDLVALVGRRVVEAGQRGLRHLPLDSSPRCAARGADLARFVAGDVDTDRCLGLARALMALKWAEWAHSDIRLSRTAGAGEQDPGDLWVLLRLAHLPWPLEGRPASPLDPAITRALETGDGAGAIRIAIRRLRGAGLVSGFRAGALSPERARRISASLAFPISRADAHRWALRLTPSSDATTSQARGARHDR
ncbi:type I-U CRISPR-associated protein Csx17 [bacterium]|nr:type I-U CRISPR-associated protein Csx17 [bacterium]